MKPIPVPSLPVPVPIDPRIRRRRIEVRRMEGRRRLRFLLVVLGVLAASVAVWVTTRSPLLDVDAVDVTGTVHVAVQDVRRAAGLAGKVPMIDVDGVTVAKRVEDLPWVAEARVERRWPGRVVISIAERVALAAAPDGDGWWLLDRSGRVLERVTAPPPGLVVVEGVSAAPAPGAEVAGGEAALEVAASLSPALRELVASVAALESGEIQLKLHPEGTVRLGGPVQIEAKLAAVETVLAQVERAGLAELDVRLPASPVLTRV